MTRVRWKRGALGGLVSALIVVPGMSLAAAMESPHTNQGSETDGAEESWRIRGQTRRGAGREPSAPMRLRESVRLVGDVACNRKEDILRGRLFTAGITLVLDRTPGDPEGYGARTPSSDCARSLESTSPFSARAKLKYPRRPGEYVTTGWMAVRRSFRLLADLSERKSEQVLESGTNARITLTLRRLYKPVPDMIVALSRRYGIDSGTALRVAWCESHYDPQTYSPAGYGGVFQQDVDYWPGRASNYGHPGASVFDAYPNVDVSLKMARDQGWGHWGCY